MPLPGATQVLPNVWVVRCGGPPTPQQPPPVVPVAVRLPLSPRGGFATQPAAPPPAPLPPSYFPQLGSQLGQAYGLQGYGPSSLTPPSSPSPYGASPAMYSAAPGSSPCADGIYSTAPGSSPFADGIYSAAPGSSPFADGRPGLGSPGDGRPGTPRLVQPPASPLQLAAEVPERPMRPPPPAELAWLLSQLPPASPLSQLPPGDTFAQLPSANPFVQPQLGSPLAPSGLQPSVAAYESWQQNASLVQGLPPCQAQPLLQPVEPLPPPPPLPSARMLQPRGPEPPGAIALGSGFAPAHDGLQLPPGLEGQLTEQQLLLPFLDCDLPSLDTDLLDLIDW